jgi:6-phosphogluconate dehydrogenase
VSPVSSRVPSAEAALTRVWSGTPVTLIGEAVFARCLSALKGERVKASKVLGGPQEEPFKGDKQQFIDDLEQALYASKIISYDSIGTRRALH